MIRAIITGATGMVGEGVLHECLNSREVSQVLIINRKPSGITHPKLKEIIHSDFFNLAPVAEQLKGYNACYFCLGVTSLGKSQDDYYRLTYTLTKHFADTVVNGDMTFCYVSGAGTYTNEQGSLHWARVKGKTENEIIAMPFKDAYAFRPGVMRPTPGLSHAKGGYRLITWLYPVFKLLFPKSACTLAQVGQAMINVTLNLVPNKRLEVTHIIALGKAA